MRSEATANILDGRQRSQTPFTSLEARSRWYGICLVSRHTSNIQVTMAFIGIQALDPQGQSLEKQVSSGLLHQVSIGERESQGLKTPDCALGPSIGLTPGNIRIFIHRAPRVLRCIAPTVVYRQKRTLKRVCNGHTGVCACAITKSFPAAAVQFFRPRYWQGRALAWLETLHSPVIEMPFKETVR